MCAIFGLLDFGNTLTPAQRIQIFSALGTAAEVRGTDASGVAYVQNGSIQIQKAPRPAHKMRWRVSPTARYLMGHTRMTTQGAASKNYNNHPFPGRAGSMPFALAHNGVLYNDRELQHRYKLPYTKIETDSYAAVQLIEHQRGLSAKSLQAMAEALEGSFTITVLDASNNLYFVKGNNPLTIWLLPTLGCYLYASTAEILEAALAALPTARTQKAEIVIRQGDILKIDRQGRRTVTHFDDSNLIVRRYYGGLYDWYGSAPTVKSRAQDPYLEEVLAYGMSQGVPESELRLLIDDGYTAFDLDELLFDHELRQRCVQDAMSDLGGW